MLEEGVGKDAKATLVSSLFANLKTIYMCTQQGYYTLDKQLEKW